MAIVTLVRHVFAALTGVRRLFGNIACLGQCPLGHNGTDDLVDEDGEKYYEGNDACYLSAENSVTFDGAYHTQRDTCLWKERNTEIFDDVGGAFGHLCRAHSAEIFTDTTGNYVNYADEDEQRLCKYVEVELSTAEDEE